MKKILFLMLICLASCVKDVYNPNNSIYVSAYELSFIPENTMVTLNKDTIAMVYNAMNIETVKGYKYKYTEINTKKKNEGWYKKNFTLCFEDSPKGDLDYNDLVVHIDAKYHKDIAECVLTPMALGSTFDISLGYINNGIETILYEDCRKELFNNQKGFINTLEQFPKIKFNKIKYQINNPIDIEYFIIVNNKKKYIAFDATKNKTPFGLIVPEKFKYPKECVNIRYAYPLFNKWLNEEIVNYWNHPNKDKIYE